MSVSEKLKSGASVVAITTALSVTPLAAKELSDQAEADPSVTVSDDSIAEPLQFDENFDVQQYFRDVLGTLKQSFSNLKERLQTTES